MLENYERLPSGVIRQIDVSPITYDLDYVKKRYDGYGDLRTKMSFLRLGFVVGSIGRIPESILDVGYGNGDFLSACSSIIPRCYGNDISQYPLPRGTRYADLYEHHFDVVTFFDSLEHFTDIAFIDDLRCDYVVISVPNCLYKSDDWFFSWKHRRPSEHLYHFNEQSLKNFFDGHGYKFITSTNIEDAIRKDPNNSPNILTATFKKK